MKKCRHIPREETAAPRPVPTATLHGVVPELNPDLKKCLDNRAPKSQHGILKRLYFIKRKVFETRDVKPLAKNSEPDCTSRFKQKVQFQVPTVISSATSLLNAEGPEDIVYGRGRKTPHIPPGFLFHGIFLRGSSPCRAMRNRHPQVCYNTHSVVVSTKAGGPETWCQHYTGELF